MARFLSARRGDRPKIAAMSSFLASVALICLLGAAVACEAKERKDGLQITILVRTCSLGV